MLPAHGSLGVLGFLAGVALLALLTRDRGLSFATAAWLVPTCVLVSFSVAMATKIVTGEERHRYLHYEIAFLASVPLVLWLAGEPVLPYLDIVLMGLGTVLAFGRVGCLLAGCCHGKPADRGVRYGEAHVAGGFLPELAHVRLFPVQLLEAALVAGLVAVGVVLIVSGAEPGSAATWYVMGYGVIRFALEYLRGDSVRSYIGGFSWVQWTVLAMAGVTVALEAAGVLPFVPWHAAALAVMAGVVVLGRRPPGIGHPRHVRELAAVLRELDPPPPIGLPVRTTSLGVSVSSGWLAREGRRYRLYSLSRIGGLDEPAARRLATLVARLEGAPPGWTLVSGDRGVFHLLVAQPGAQETPRELSPEPHGAGLASSHAHLTSPRRPRGARP